MALVLSPLSEVNMLSHAISYDPVLQDIQELGEDGIVHMLYCRTADRVVRRIRQLEAALGHAAPGSESMAAALALFRYATNHIDYLGLENDVIQRLFRHYRLYWFFRSWQPDDVRHALEDTFDDLVEFCTGGRAFMPMRQYVISLMDSGCTNIDWVLVHAAGHSVAMTGVHTHLRANHRADRDVADRWNLLPVATNGGTDITHEVVVIADDSDMEEYWTPPPSDEDDDYDYDWVPVDDTNPVVTDYHDDQLPWHRCTDDEALLREFDDWCDGHEECSRFEDDDHCF